MYSSGKRPFQWARSAQNWSWSSGGHCLNSLTSFRSSTMISTPLYCPQLETPPSLLLALHTHEWQMWHKVESWNDFRAFASFLNTASVLLLQAISPLGLMHRLLIHRIVSIVKFIYFYTIHFPTYPLSLILTIPTISIPAIILSSHYYHRNHYSNQQLPSSNISSRSI